MESDHPRARHLYEIAEELGCTIADLVGPERAKNYPANKQEADLIDFMRGLDETQQEAFSLMVRAAALGVLSAEDLQVMAEVGRETGNPMDPIMAWRNGLTAKQAAQCRAAR